MLTHVHIKDFAIIDEVDLELDTALTVLTGETGAGKSILVDALGLVLGDRAEASAVRHEARRAQITASFALENNPPAREWLSQQTLDADDECIIRRVIGADGRSRAFVNGQPVTVQSLRELGERLVDIHGQQDHQSLTRRGIQRDIVDHHGRHDELRRAVRERFSEWSALRASHEQLTRETADRDSRLDWLRHQVTELEALAPRENEIEELEREYRVLSNSGQIVDGLRQALDLIYDSEHSSALERLTRASRELSRLGQIDQQLNEVVELLRVAEINVGEAADQLQRHLADIDLDPKRLDAVQTRIAALQDMGRKHRVEPPALPERLETLKVELAAVEHADVRLQNLTAELEQAERNYLEAAERLSSARRGAADGLGEQLTTLMQELGMPGGRFEIEISERTPLRYALDGLDRVEFLVSANPGVPPRPLSKVASGGELSRIGLAVQVVAADATAIPSLVFDEVDAGIGGGIAEIVGRRLRELGRQRQVLCVTHLPQVASQSEHHIRVSKLAGDEASRTVVEPLSQAARVEELARMLGGTEITERTRAHAREMIERAHPHEAAS